MAITKQLTGPIDFHSRKKKILWKSMGPVRLLPFFHISSFVFSRRKKFVQVLNNLRVSI